MQRPQESGWIGRVILAVRALFGGVADTDSSPAGAIAAPLAVDNTPSTLVARAPRMLAARLAVQAKLNVPVGKKARVAPRVSAHKATRRPVEVAVAKRSPTARSVFLPARHLAARAAPMSRANVITLPVAKVARPVAKSAHARSNRIAA